MLGDWLIAVGGYDGNQYLKTVEQYDTESNEWQQIAPVNYSRAGACVVAIPNNVPSAIGAAAVATGGPSTSSTIAGPLVASSSSTNTTV